jgi:hypothetical protein
MRAKRNAEGRCGDADLLGQRADAGWAACSHSGDLLRAA